jgi:hypothetical protein
MVAARSAHPDGFPDFPISDPGKKEYPEVFLSAHSVFYYDIPIVFGKNQPWKGV